MALLTDVMKDGKKHRCEKCKEIFSSEEIIIKKRPDYEVDFSPPVNIIFLAKDGVICACRKTKDIPMDAWLLACPKCGAVNLMGYDKVE